MKTEKISFSVDLVKSFVSKKLRKEKLLLFFSFLVIIILVFLGVKTNIFIPQIPKDQIIKESAVKQGRVIVSQPVKWVRVVVSSEIKENRKYIELPKSAKDIIIKKGEAAKEAFLAPKQEIGIEEVKGIAQVLEQAPAPIKKSNALAKTWSSLTANIGTALNQLTTAKKQEPFIETRDNKFINLQNIENLPKQNLITIEYYTEGPQSKEVKTKNGKQVIILASEELNYRDVLAFAKLDELYSVNEKDKIKIFWQEEKKYIDFNVYDLDEDGKIDYVEWNVPNLKDRNESFFFSY